MAAQMLSQAGVSVHLFDAMPSVGRKFLLAGQGGLNLTHAEPSAQFRSRYGTHQAQVGRWLDQMDAQAVRAWAKDLGVDTFVGSSGRVFPLEMKAAPLLRAWLQRLRHPVSGVPVQFHMRHRWLGWDVDQLLFQSTGREHVNRVRARTTLLALGGASWPRLGSDGAWQSLLAEQGVEMQPLAPANCGFDVWGREGSGWSEHFCDRYAGHPLKSVVLRLEAGCGLRHEPISPPRFERQGEFVITNSGVEGSLIYAASALLRNDLAQGAASFKLDLLPGKSLGQVLSEVSRPRGSRSLSSHLKSRLGLSGVKAGLIYELCAQAQLRQPEMLAALIKALPVALKAPRPVQEAISSAGGVAWSALSPELMLKTKAGVYCAGEMLDWEAPTGGYLLTACLASGLCAAKGMLENLVTKSHN